MPQYFYSADDANILDRFSVVSGNAPTIQTKDSKNVVSFQGDDTNSVATILGPSPSFVTEILMQVASLTDGALGVNHYYTFGRRSSDGSVAFNATLRSSDNQQTRRTSPSGNVVLTSEADNIVSGKTLHWRRLRIETDRSGTNETTVYDRIWDGSPSDEPSAWDTVVTDTDSASIIAGVPFIGASDYDSAYRFISIGTDGDPAPFGGADISRVTEKHTHFDLYTSGEQPSDWERSYSVDADISWIVEDDTSAINGKVLRLVNTRESRSGLTWNALDSASNRENTDIYIRFKINSVGGYTEDEIGTLTRAIKDSVNDSPVTGIVGRAYTTGVVGLTVYDDGGLALNTTSPPGTSLSENDWYWLRVRTVGALTQVKRWSASEAQPEAWDFEDSETTVTAAGAIGLFVFEFSDISIDTFSVKTDATLPVTEGTPGYWDAEDYAIGVTPSADWNLEGTMSLDPISDIGDGRKGLPIYGAAATRGFAECLTAPSFQDGELFVRMWVSSSSSTDMYIFGRGTNLSPTSGATALRGDYYRSEFRVSHYESGNFSSLTSTSQTIDRPGIIMLRLNFKGGDVKLRFWQEPDPEPTTWLLEGSSTVISEGTVGIGGYRLYEGYLKVLFMGWMDGDGSAPTAPVPSLAAPINLGITNLQATSARLTWEQG